MDADHVIGSLGLRRRSMIGLGGDSTTLASHREVSPESTQYGDMKATGLSSLGGLGVSSDKMANIGGQVSPTSATTSKSEKQLTESERKS